jgi:hypothetical protein
MHARDQPQWILGRIRKAGGGRKILTAWRRRVERQREDEKQEGCDLVEVHGTGSSS